MSDLREGQELIYSGKTILVNKRITYIDGVPCIECSYLKKILSIDNFVLRKNKKNTYYISQPSRLGAKQKAWDLGINKPKIIKNKIIDGNEFRYCNELKEFRPISEFGKIRNGKNYRSVCRAGKAIENKRNKKSIDRAVKRWKSENKDKINHGTAKRRAALKNALPRWLTKDDYGLIKKVFLHASRMEKETGEMWHVHHIYPLVGKNDNGEHISCGLHVPWNLKAIPAILNMEIGDKNPEYHSVDLSRF